MRRAHFLMPWIVGAALAAFPAAPLAAEVVVFDNSDGTFWWEPVSEFGGAHLDITLPPTQSGKPTANSFSNIPGGLGASSSSWLTAQFESDQEGRLATSPHAMRIGNQYYTYFLFPPLPYAPTQTIGAAEPWADQADVSVGYAGAIGTSITIGVR